MSNFALRNQLRNQMTSFFLFECTLTYICTVKQDITGPQMWSGTLNISAVFLWGIIAQFIDKLCFLFSVCLPTVSHCSRVTNVSIVNILTWNFKHDFLWRHLPLDGSRNLNLVEKSFSVEPCHPLVITGTGSGHNNMTSSPKILTLNYKHPRHYMFLHVYLSIWLRKNVTVHCVYHSEEAADKQAKRWWLTLSRPIGLSLFLTS